MTDDLVQARTMTEKKDDKEQGTQSANHRPVE